MQRLICPVCQREGLKSQVNMSYRTTTAMYANQYYDESGNYHYHDLNKSTQLHYCSNGHRFAEITQPACPSCTEYGSYEIKEIETTAKA